MIVRASQMTNVKIDFRPFLEADYTDSIVEILELINDPELTRQIFETQRAKQWGDLITMIEGFSFDSPMTELASRLHEDPIQRGKSS